VTAGRSTEKPVLRIRDLRVSLGGTEILHGLGFDVASSGVTALLGRNGVGKTTTARAIMGLIPAAGVIELDDTDLTRLPTHRRAALGIGYVPEDRAVFSALTVEENLRLAEGISAGPGRALVGRLFPVLAERATQPAGTLSGGEQQMVALARVLLRPGRLLVIDEPTKGLAPKVATEVAVALRHMAEQAPILLIEQNLTVVRHVASHAVVLDTGRVVHTGDASELLDDPVLANRLLGVSSNRRGQVAPINQREEASS
jgi:branched-chain amino acid transport system ATP-binding protein